MIKLYTSVIKRVNCLCAVVELKRGAWVMMIYGLDMSAGTLGGRTQHYTCISTLTPSVVVVLAAVGEGLATGDFATAAAAGWKGRRRGVHIVQWDLAQYFTS